jgi:hypothetical protein
MRGSLLRWMLQVAGRRGNARRCLDYLPWGHVPVSWGEQVDEVGELRPEIAVREECPDYGAGTLAAISDALAVTEQCESCLWVPITLSWALTWRVARDKGRPG